MNNCQSLFYDKLCELLQQLKCENMLKWKWMRCVEVAAAVLAEVLCNNGVSIDCDTEVISWPFGTVSSPPNSDESKKKGKGGKGKGKVVKSGKSGTIFGVLVNKIQKEHFSAKQKW